jgi:antitoxin (DNA-binding transcriptional repressor) of toxin-antitoxin stability system
MTKVTIDEAESRLRELIAALQPGEEVQITDGKKTVARLVAEPSGQRKPRKPGSAVGQLVIVSDDDDHLEDFRDYMP